MNLERLREIDELFAHRREAFAILCLAEGPLRYNQLAHAISTYARKRIPDSTVSRLRRRLVATGVVATTRDSKGHVLYQLTTLGRAKAARVLAIIKAVDAFTGGDESGDEDQQSPTA